MSYHVAKKERGSLKESRIDIRVKPQQKQLIEKAAAIRNLDTSAFVLSNVLRIAEQEIATYEKITLSNEDRDRFVEAINTPSKPNSALKKAAKEFQKKYHR